MHMHALYQGGSTETNVLNNNLSGTILQLHICNHKLNPQNLMVRMYLISS